MDRPPANCDSLYGLQSRRLWACSYPYGHRYKNSVYYGGRCYGASSMENFLHVRLFAVFDERTPTCLGAVCRWGEELRRM